MSKEAPLVSVVMPAYNAEKYIGEAIESILNQTFTDFEFIILDDGSTDNTWQIIQDYAQRDSRIIPIKNEENLKLAKTLNLGIQNSQGKYIARMDADDISHPERLHLQVEFMGKNSSVGILGGSMEIMNQLGETTSKRNYHLTDKEIRKHLFIYSPFCHPAIMIRKDFFKKTSGYIHEFNPAEDYELYFQLGRICEFANLPETLLRYRVVENSMTMGKLKNMELKTIKVRLKYFLKYKASIFDMLYTAVQFLTIYLMPPELRVKVFTKIREKEL